MAAVSCVLIVDDKEIRLTLADDLPGAQLVASVVDELRLPAAQDLDRYFYTLRDPVSRLQILGDDDTLASVGIREGARLKVHRTTQRMQPGELVEEAVAEPATIVDVPNALEPEIEEPALSPGVQAADAIDEAEAEVEASEPETEAVAAAAEIMAAEEPQEPVTIEFTVVSEERELEVSFLDDSPARETIRAIVQQFELPTVEDGNGIVYTLEHPAEGELVLGERETLRQAGVTAASRLTLFKVIQPNIVSFTIINEQQELPASLPKNKPVRELIEHLVQNLPETERGQKILYALEHPAEGRLLITDEETLEGVGVEDGSTLRLLKILYPAELRDMDEGSLSGSTLAADEEDAEAEDSDGESDPAEEGRSRLSSFASGLGSVLEDGRPYLLVLASSVALIAFFLMPATDNSLFGLSSPTVFDLTLEVEEVVDASDRDVLYVSFQWAVAAILAACVGLIGLTAIVDRQGRAARMRAGSTLGFLSAGLLVVGWVGIGIVDETIVDALSRGSPMGFWARGDYPATPGFAVMSVALLLSILAGIGAGRD